MVNRWMEEVSREGAGTVCILIIYLDADITWRTLVSSVFFSQPWHGSLGLFGAPAALKTLYYQQTPLISIQPNMTWLSGSVSEVLPRVFLQINCMYVCEQARGICIHAHVHAHTA